ncbi:hypothetical protein LI012_12730 [Caldibacillus thermoamylovorans]|uniref:hypothetical protein n=1 Tax=Bacillaceae TaxID=186817 RepID=UPI001D06D85E|nr:MULTISPECIES: hypothetical protein [Bacillaceae]MCB5935641.1 hypothetical protein [Bacillus sp. DFI.2.34]MCB7077677.1 hypothetical protein [Caldibacillus thermoamylovorans]MED4852150.1 hypothetical protein [Caldifermentibacillus hisashii]
MGKQKMTAKQIRINSDLLDRFNRVNNALAANGSEVIRRLMETYVIQKEEELKVKVEDVIEMKENFPIDGEAYVIGKGENGKFFFAWGSEVPYVDEVPLYDVPNGECGIKWFGSKNEALAAMNEAVEAREPQ